MPAGFARRAFTRLDVSVRRRETAAAHDLEVSHARDCRPLTDGRTPGPDAVAHALSPWTSLRGPRPCTSAKAIPLNISKYEQRVLHALAQGGRIAHRRNESGAIFAADCFTREGHVLADCTLSLFRRLKRRRLIASMDGQPYRITRLGLEAVRAQLDNR
jgi:uncharacterized protein YjhX (UPF0386 family)